MSVKINFAIRCLKKSGVISIPTDTIQGISCLPNNTDAINKILTLKHRSNNKGLILLASDIKYFQPYVKDATLLHKIKITKTPTTYLLKANANVCSLLTGDFDTIALRLTNNFLIKALCQGVCSALVSTSANISGKPSATSILDLNIFFGDNLDYVITPNDYNSDASKIINLETGEILR